MKGTLEKSKYLAAVLLLVLLIIPALSQQTSPEALQEMRLTEGVLRLKITKMIMPRYPDEAKKAGATGVAVAGILVDEEGRVAIVTMLEAPHQSAAKAVSEAVQQWRFRPGSLQGRPLRYRSKLTFYFVIDKDGPRVENPSSARKPPSKRQS